MHTLLPYKLKNFKQTLYASKCFLAKKRNADGVIHADRGHIVTSVLQNAKNIHRAI
jgi:hypothetical protein